MMKPITITACCLFFMAITACASQGETPASFQFIVGFNNAESQQPLAGQQQATINQWQKATRTKIEFIRTLSGNSWVIKATLPADKDTASAKAEFIKQLQTQHSVKYVEEDQIIQLNPVEQPEYPVRVY